MTPERWQHVARIYDLVVDLEVDSREAFLADACAGDELLRLEVESLLGQDTASLVLDRPIWATAAPLFEEEPDLYCGVTLGPYRIEGVIGAGGMGQVFSATDTRLDRLVAIKVLPPNVASDSQMRARFAREAKAIAALTHPHICRLYDVGCHDGIDFLVMEYLEGETLAARLGGGPLPLDQAIPLAIEIAGALDHAHRHGIVHRDLKPSNIMLTASGTKLLDFGLAKFRPAVRANEQDTEATRFDADGLPGAHKPVDKLIGDDGHVTRAGAILGTVRYMAPEQIEGREVDAQSDLFAFGAVLYEMLTGKRAFEGETASEVRTAILERDPVPLTSIQPEAPATLDEVLRRCLAKSREARWPTATDVIRELKLALAAIVEARTKPVAGHLTRWVAGIAVIVLVGLAIWALTGGLRRSISPAAGEQIRVLAVLPFANAANDEDVEYLCDGITESLIQQIARLPALTVMARSTVFNFKGKPIDPREAGRQLGVDAILTGTVSRRSGRLRITAELVQVASGAQLWGNTFDRAATEVVSVQDEIASAIVEEGIQLRLSRDERTALVQHPTNDPEAYEWYLRARHAHFRATEEDLLQARDLLSRAIRRDPSFAQAYKLLAANYVAMALDGYERPIDAMPQANRNVSRAHQIDSQLAEAHSTAASIAFFFDWDWASAKREWALANSLPSGALPTQELVGQSLGQWVLAGPEEALGVVKKLRALDPLTVSYAVMEADFLFHAGQLDAAAALYEKTLNDSVTANALFGLAEVRFAQGRFDEAIAARRRAHAEAGDDWVLDIPAPVSGADGYRRIDRAGAQYELETLAARAAVAYVSPLDFARAHAQLGNREQAFSYFDAAFADRAPGLVFLKVDRAWDPVRDDPRFAAATRRVGLP